MTTNSTPLGKRRRPQSIDLISLNEFFSSGISYTSLGAKANLLNDLIWKPDGPIPSTIQNFQLGPNYLYDIPSDSAVDRYITHGAGTNIPSEYLGYCFSGLEAATGGYMEDENDTATPNKTVSQMIKVNMTMMGSAQWSVLPLNPDVPARGGAQLPFIPRGEQGLLIAIGGVPFPVDAGTYSTTFIQQEGASLMTDLSVFDIAGEQWYSQSTTGEAPPKTAEFCTVVAHENGTNSYQIYVYGGYDGSDLSGPTYNTVWILSVPSFQWTNATPTNSDAGRFGHICVMPYPDQMLVVAGTGTFAGRPFPGGKIVELLNLTSIEWLSSYDPAAWGEYSVPDILKNQGNLDQKADGMDRQLAALFDQPYQTPIQQWYPYKATSGSSGHKWLAPVLGGALGGVALVVAGFSVWLYFHKKKRRESSSKSGSSDTQVAEDGVNEWRQQVPQAKSTVSTGVMEIDSCDRSTVNTDPQEPIEIGGQLMAFAPRSPRSSRSPVPPSSPRSPRSDSVEVSGDPLFRQELQDTSPRQRPVQPQPSPRMSEPDYQFKNHPLFPLNVTDAVSVADTTLTTDRRGQPPSSVGADMGSATSMSYQAAPLGTDDFEQFVYGRLPPPHPPQPMSPRQGIKHEGAHVQSQQSFTRRLAYDDIYPGDALPSPSTGANELQPTPQFPTAVNHDLGMSPLETSNGSMAKTGRGMAPAEATSPLPFIHSQSSTMVQGEVATTPSPTPTRPVANRNHRSLSSEIQPPSGDPLPSPDLEEETRRSVIIDTLPNSPTQLRSSASAPDCQDSNAACEDVHRRDPSGAAYPPAPAPAPAAPLTPTPGAGTAPTTGVRRKEVGSPVARSAYEENRMRFPERHHHRRGQ